MAQSAMNGGCPAADGCSGIEPGEFMGVPMSNTGVQLVSRMHGVTVLRGTPKEPLLSCGWSAPSAASRPGIVGGRCCRTGVTIMLSAGVAAAGAAAAAAAAADVAEASDAPSRVQAFSAAHVRVSSFCSRSLYESIGVAGERKELEGFEVELDTVSSVEQPECGVKPMQDSLERLEQSGGLGVHCIFGLLLSLTSGSLATSDISGQFTLRGVGVPVCRLAVLREEPAPGDIWASKSCCSDCT